MLIALPLLLLPVAGNNTFDGEDDARPDWLPRLCVGWEMPVCFYPHVPLGKLRVLSGCSEYLCCLRLS